MKLKKIYFLKDLPKHRMKKLHRHLPVKIRKLIIIELPFQRLLNELIRN